MEGREKYLLQHYYMLRPLLSSAQRTQLFTLPENLSEQELIRHYTLSPDDLGFILPQREDHNRLGFAAQLVYQRVLGRPMMAGETVPYALLTYLAAQLHLSPQVFALYAKRDTTRREHAAKIQKYLRLQSLTARNEQVLRQMLLPKALQTGSNIAVVAALLEEMRSRKIIIPSIPTVEKIAYTIQQEARHILFAELTSNLEAWQKDRLDTLLTLRDKTQTYFVWLKNFPRRPTPQNVLSALDRIAYIDGLGLLPRGSNLCAIRHSTLNGWRKLGAVGCSLPSSQNCAKANQLFLFPRGGHFPVKT
jgi:TnpA family transposase